jgi:hypothetical protein
MDMLDPFGAWAEANCGLVARKRVTVEAIGLVSKGL